jgi:hypothetical protein
MKRSIWAAAVWAGIAGAALAGGTAPERAGYNIDFNAPSGTGAGLPPNTFGGAAGQAGVWNSIGTSAIASGATFGLLSADATAIAHMSVTYTGTGMTAFGTSNANTTGDYEKLLDDIVDLGSAGQTVTVTITDLGPGVYEVYTYAGAPDNASYRTNVGLFDRPAVSIGGAFPVNGFTEGVTHARQRIAIGLSNSSITITLTVPTVAGISNSGSLAGIQIKPLNPTRLYCKTTAGGIYNDGMSWDTALAFTSMAAQIAGTTPSVTEVWAARSTASNSGWPLVMRNGLSLYGGFLGTETTLGARTVNANLTSTLTQVSGAPNSAGDDSLPHVVTANGTDSTAVLDGFWIRDGVAGVGAGAAGVQVVGAATLRNCRISNNTANSSGGGLGVYNPTATSTFTMTDCVVTANTSGNQGGGANFSYGNYVLTRCSFTSNHANGGSGGGIDHNGQMTLTSCLFAANTASFAGAGVASTGGDEIGPGSVTMLNCTVARNSCPSGYWAGVHLVDVTYSVHNSIFWGNTNFQAMPLQDKQFSASPAVMNQITDSIVEGWNGTLATAAYLNNDADPRFFGAAAGNFQLQPFSPAIDTGWNGGLPGAATATDLLGSPRVVDDPGMNNAGFGGGTIDRGCYERQAASSSCAGDIGRTGGLEGGDGAKNNNDLVVFINWFFTPDSRADVGATGGVAHPDGTLDNNDFIVYIDMFFAACP